MPNRWWIYQRERFPLLAHGFLIAVLSTASVSYIRLSMELHTLPDPRTLLVAFLSGLAFFFLLRVADEFKDYDEDLRFRPYRAVPRGLVSLRELAWIGGGMALLQALLALWHEPALLFLLLIVWAYFGLMSMEFFVPSWLKKHPLAYLFSHMIILPLIVFYLSACEWLSTGTRPPQGWGWLVFASFFCGLIIELGRKIRAPEDEEEGVTTYSALWGPARAVGLWGLFIVVASLATLGATRLVGFFIPSLVVLGLGFLFTLVQACLFARNPTSKGAKQIESLSGIWTLIVYLLMGILPLLFQTWKV